MFFAPCPLLAAIHKAEIVHRDFKPSNVLIGADGPRVIGFGIARALDQPTATSGKIVGTPAYMSPEQLSGLTVGPESDVFSWAVTMVFAATGRPAFGEDTIPAIFNRVRTHPAPGSGHGSGYGVGPRSGRRSAYTASEFCGQ